jgi:hypothetical protein
MGNPFVFIFFLERSVDAAVFRKELCGPTSAADLLTMAFTRMHLAPISTPCTRRVFPCPEASGNTSLLAVITADNDPVATNELAIGQARRKGYRFPKQLQEPGER